MKTAEMVLQQMQVLDQQIATPLAAAENPLNLGQSGWIDLPTLRVIRPAPTPRTGMDPAVVI
jgi:hypothetical protein